MTHLLHIDASARSQGSISRELSTKITARFEGATITRRDLANALPQIDEAWIGANFTPAADRSDAQTALLAQSDSLVDEIMAADVLVIGVPIYNFSVPASLKAWIDLISRVGRTFQYTENGPQGLLTNKRAILAVASGGTQVESAIDFAVPYLKHVLAFNGITEVEVIAADALGQDAEAKLQSAQSAIAALAT
ncbi:FMN-dependent NADH-azoreductase [Halocynthiibacter namhaensis]|uniref:FMN-dependent NADH-azoreductase n=1 Tax=Halocynthiibacter namhaensis TaxID=1290553 RepID=UPI00192E6E70|nr:NAD(P)H-dependent oxidoreductase [Halocynthiibacter namhaensis]